MIHQYRPNFDHRELLAAVRLGAGRKEFELALAKRVGARYAISFAYGRSGIVATCRALNLTEAEVILPAYTCLVVGEAVVVSGNQPVFVDIDFADFNMDMSALKDAVTPKTRAIIATHMHGYPTDVAAIRAALGDDKIVIIEDAALLGPTKRGSGRDGLKSDVAFYSFGPGKHLYAIRGGVIVTDNADIFEKLRAYRDRKMNSLPPEVLVKRMARFMTGYMMQNASLFEMWNRVNQTHLLQRTRDQLGLARVAMPDDYGTAFADFQGRVGLAQLRKFDSVVAQHRAWAEFYHQELQDLPLISRPPIVEGATYSHYSLQVSQRDKLGFRERMRTKGVEVGTAFDYAVPYLEPYRAYARKSYPHAEQLAREVVNLPNYARLNEADTRYIADCTRQCIQEALHH